MLVYWFYFPLIVHDRLLQTLKLRLLLLEFAIQVFLSHFIDTLFDQCHIEIGCKANLAHEEHDDPGVEQVDFSNIELRSDSALKRRLNWHQAYHISLVIMVGVLQNMQLFIL